MNNTENTRDAHGCGLADLTYLVEQLIFYSVKNSLTLSRNMYIYDLLPRTLQYFT